MKTPTLPKVTVKLVREPKPHGYEPVTVHSPTDVAVFLEFLKEKTQEHFVVLLLDVRNQIIGMNIVSIGTSSSSLVNPPDVFRPALLSNARNIICAHNHPSGLTEPSSDDLTTTNTLIACGKLLNIGVLDHLIIGDDTYSIRENYPKYWS